MRAFVIDTFGEAGAVRDLPTPEPSAGQVRVRVRTAGVNPVDASVAAGFAKDFMEHRFPLVVGVDAFGVVDAIGDTVDAWSVGDEVFGSVGKMYFGEGTFAEFATMSSGTIARRPPSIDPELAAVMPTAGVTALTMLDAIGLGADEVILVNGASGGVGSFFVPVAARTGARVIAVCRGESADYVRHLGATDVIDHTSEDVIDAVGSRFPDGIDAIADMVGDDESVTRLAGRLRAGGRVASCAGGADEEALAKRDVKGVNTMTMVTTDQLVRLAKPLEEGAVRAPEVQALPFDRAADALAQIGSRHVRGKLVLTVS